MTDYAALSPTNSISGQPLAELAGQIRRMELELASADLPEEKRARLQKTLQEALSILAREEERQQHQGASGRRPGVARRLYRKTLSAALLLTQTVRFVASRTLSLGAVIFLVYFSLGFFPHPAKWNQWVWVAKLTEVITPLLAWIDSVLEWPEAFPFYPLLLAFAGMMASIAVDSKLTRLCGWLRKKRESKGKPRTGSLDGGPSPISWLGANPYAPPPLGRPALALRDPNSSW